MKLTHLDENGAAHMVNIGAKPVTQREAVAQSVLTMPVSYTHLSVAHI